MRTILIALAAAVLSAGPAAASDKTDVMATVRQFVEAFNKGDAKAVTGTCAAQTSILDEFPPHEWHGAGACTTWMNDFDADAKKNGITDGAVALSAPRYVDVTADVAYVVVPANYTFKRKGRPEKETASIMTLTLRKSAAAWQITGWSWAKH